ncbi:hypothetical protein GQ53DRAFT_750566 [Thozetella sp. PMI_491]|nr:hypothetical protein GQ53DRAFT_750566 [Thozetella sp. PMI_491]
MLLNLRGEKVFIGGSASISFLQLVREIVSDHIGPTGFSHNETSESMLEVPSPPTNADRLIPPLGELDVEQKQRYSRAFCAVTEGLLDIFSASELESLIMGTRATDTTGISADKRATVELIIAVGAKCESPESANGHAKAYCRHAQQLVFADMLSSPSVDMVRTFILMAFYMLCECRRNTAFMYLGIAARAAVSLGLHSHFSYLDGSLRYRLRLRIWMSLCILDMLVSSLLGRPGATVGLRGDLDNSLAEISAAANNNQTQSVITSYRILSIITDTVEKIYEQKQMSRSVVEQQLAKIDSWRLSLPGDLLTNPVPASQGAAASHTGSIGKIHVSCLYYYAVTLATRPVLISTLTALLANGDPRHLQLAAACVDASVFMIQNCQEAYRAGIFLGNMCIIKALVFSAGLILGFEIFAKREMDYEIAAAFRGAGDVLSFLAAQSPQAAHYLDILTTLSRAILQQRENLSSRVKSGFVCKLLSIDSVKFRDRPGISASFPGHRRQGGGLIALAEASAAVRADSNGGLVENTIGIPVRNNGRQEESAMADGEVFFGLDSLDLSQWDKFPFLELDRGVT